MSSRAFAARARELTGVPSPGEMIRSNQRKFHPRLGLLADAETEATTCVSDASQSWALSSLPPSPHAAEGFWR